MYLHNALKKLEKYGEIKQNGSRYSVTREGCEVEVLRNGGDDMDTVAVIRVRSINDHDDFMSDYSAGVFCDTLSQAIKLANWNEETA